MLRRKKRRASSIGSSSGASSETAPSTWASALPTMTKAGGRGTPWRTEIAVSWLSSSTRLDLLERATADLGDHRRDVVAVVLDVDLGGVRDPAQIERDVGEQVDVALREGEQDEEQLAARLGVEAADHAQVEQPDPAVGPEHVARVRVGVEEALLEHLLVVGLHQLARRLGALRALRGLEQRNRRRRPRP